MARTSIAGMSRHQASNCRGGGCSSGGMAEPAMGRARSKRVPLPLLHAWPRPSGQGGPTTQSKQVWPALVGMALVGALRAPGFGVDVTPVLVSFQVSETSSGGTPHLGHPQAARNLQLLLRHCQTGTEHQAWTLIVRSMERRGSR